MLMCTVFGSGRSFTSASGLGQRMRHEQPVEPNERLAGIKRARWSDDELNQVAEIVYRHRKLINTKQTIAPLVPEKTVEVVKKACQRPKYLRLFNSFKSRDADRKARLVFLPKKSYRIDELPNKPATEFNHELADEVEECLDYGEVTMLEDPPPPRRLDSRAFL